MEKSNQERLKEYLVGEKGYLKEKLSNGKVIMLSGKWGSGKTHFWKKIIEKDLIEFQTKKQKAYIYTSLYGNTSIDKIEDNIYAQAYLCAIGGENFVLKGYKTLKDFGKRFGSFCSLLDISKVIDGVDEIQKNNIKNSALLYLEKGGIVCFDDFERKSKDIDLNDLFGFISHLAIDLNCKVVIILNDDVFEGEEKKIFSNVKEKSVSKFLKYEPSIRDLFKTIFYERIQDEKSFKYLKLRKYKLIILNTIEKTQELNARIYIQVLDNLVEWIISETAEFKIDMYIRYFIKLNINFIINHNVIKLEFKENKFNCSFKSFKNQEILIIIESLKIEDDYQKDFNIKKLRVESNILSEEEIKSIYFNVKLYCCYFEEMDMRIINKINNFIETGILINE